MQTSCSLPPVDFREMAEGQSPTAMQALFTALQANHEEIHRHITNIHSTQVHEKSMSEMEAERAAYVAETTEKQRIEDSELKSKHEVEDESVRSRRALEDEELRKKRLEEDQNLLGEREQQIAEIVKRREESSKAFHDLMDGEVSKLKDAIATKLGYGQGELEELLGKRKVDTRDTSRLVW